MALFDPKSRYAKAETYVTADRRGRQVTALYPPDPPVQVALGDHVRRDGQRLDHLANFYLLDPNGFWRLAEHNGAMLPDAIAEASIIRIPRRS